MTYEQGGVVHSFPIQGQMVGPKRGDSVVTLILKLVAILALVLASLLMMLALTFAWKAASAVDDLRTKLDTPAPGVTTGCPFGAGQCGG